MRLIDHGLKLHKDTGSLTNAILETPIGPQKELKIGDTFALLEWTDRTLYVVTHVINDKKFFAARVHTQIKSYEAGIEYPKYNEDGSIKIIPNSEMCFSLSWNRWRYSRITFEEYSNNSKIKNKDNYPIHIAFGYDTGYTDPSF